MISLDKSAQPVKVYHRYIAAWILIGFIGLFFVFVSSWESDKSIQILTAPEETPSTCKDSVSMISMAHSEYTCPIGSRMGVEPMSSGGILVTCTCPPQPTVKTLTPKPATMDPAEPTCE